LLLQYLGGTEVFILSDLCQAVSSTTLLDIGTLKEILANRAELALNSSSALSIVVYVVVES